MYQYEHGGAIGFENPAVLDFSANINPLGFPDGTREAIEEAIQYCTAYPDPFCTGLRKKISEYEGVLPESVICTNGASDLIFRLALAIKPKKALVLAPTFSDYERALAAVDCEIYRHFLCEEHGFELNDELLAVIERERFSVIFICNPNNPTGCVIPKALRKQLVDLCGRLGCYIVIDECFLDFVCGSAQITAKPFLPRNEYVIIVKAFTKLFALAGLRLGYGLCANKALMERLYRIAPDWNVSNLALAAGIAALQNPHSYLDDTRNYIEIEKKKLCAALAALEVTVFGSRANYLFFKAPGALDLQAELLHHHGIYVRSCGSYHGLDNHFYRIGIRQSEANDKLIAALYHIPGLRRS